VHRDAIACGTRWRPSHERHDAAATGDQRKRAFLLHRHVSTRREARATRFGHPPATSPVRKSRPRVLEMLDRELDAVLLAADAIE